VYDVVNVVISKTLSVWLVFLGGCVLAATIGGALRLYVHWDSPGMQLTATNFVVAWIPFLVSILIAFVPDLRKAHVAWRIAIIVIGLAWSVVLARQQVLTLRESRKDQEEAIDKAVAESNRHSDDKFGQVERDLESSKTDLGAQIERVPALITKTESDLNNSISRVGTTPVRYAQLQFEVFDATYPTPRVLQTISPDSEGIYTVNFTATNISDTAATTADLWVHICQECTYAEEPKGFDRPQGLEEHSRHRMFQILNPGVTMEEMTIKLKITGGPFAYTDVFFTYSCASCGKISPPQSIRNYLLPQTPSLKMN
jgi:hypothetical protein